MSALRKPVLALAFLALSAAGNAQQSSSHTPVLDVTAMDRTIDPCGDFFHYACGGWIKNNPIPPDQSSWDLYSKMADENKEKLRGILEAASAPHPGRNAVDQKIGDYYASCMDEKAIEAKGADPLKPALQRIAGIQSKAEIADVKSTLIGANVLFPIDSIQDFRDATQVIANIDQGGLGLPDRDYYTKDDAKSQEIRQRYQQYVQTMFGLLGDSPTAAKAPAASSCSTKMATPASPSTLRAWPTAWSTPTAPSLPRFEKFA